MPAPQSRRFGLGVVGLIGYDMGVGSGIWAFGSFAGWF